MYDSYCHTQGAAVGIQLAHAGRKASTAAIANHDVCNPTLYLCYISLDWLIGIGFGA